MITIQKRHQIVISCIFLVSYLTNTVHSENVDEIIEAQKEYTKTLKETDREIRAQKQLLEETKDPIKIGSKEYERTCSLCHGINAQGHGVYAYALNKSPANLTLIKQNNNGVFPFSKLYRIIDGRDEVNAHGTRMMPIWGDRFSSESWLDTNPRNAETLARGRIFELLLYLESIQK